MEKNQMMDMHVEMGLDSENVRICLWHCAE